LDKIKRFRAKLKSEATFVAQEWAKMDEMIADGEFP
jgi:hypothetical protein